MLIKKIQTGNQYTFSKKGVWVRDFTLPVASFDINILNQEKDYPLFLENELNNERNDLPSFNPGSLKYNNAVIVSNGFDFAKKHLLLTKLPNDTAIIVTNRSLAKWTANRKIDFFVVNNPYSECKSLLPQHRYLPKCLVSTRTNFEFVKEYKTRNGVVESYSPSPEKRYVSCVKSLLQLDDYRNPICASIHLAYKLGVTKLLLLCCDDSFEGERPSAIKLENELWTYPQQLISHSIIDSMLSWYKKNKNVKVADHSSGPVYEQVPYIEEEDICKFFEIEKS